MVTTKKTATQKPTAAASKPKKGAKAQKAPVKRGISDELIPIEEETWLLQPIAVTMMRHDYSLIQVRILVSIVESLQAILHGILNNKRSPQLDLFKTKELDEDGRMPIKLPFKELGVDPNHYPQLRTSLKMLAAIPVEIPYKTSEGRKYTKATNLCDVYIPEDRSYNKYAILKLDRSVAERLVSLDFGYHRLGKQIVFACKNRYTQRIYMFIESWVDKGRTVIKTLEFRKMLRLENNYKKFSDQIYRAKNKMDAQLEQMNEMQRRQFQQMLIQYFDFTQPNAKSMAERITAELYPLAMQKLMDLRQRFNTIYVKDKAAYTFKSLDQMIREHDIPNTTVEEIKE